MARRLLSQLGHVEIITPRLDETAACLVEVLGLEESARDGESVYLRGWGEWLHNSVVLTAGDEPSVAHIGWRAAGAEELELAVAALEKAGAGEGWTDGAVGHGPAYRFRGPGGQLEEVYWEADRRDPPSPERRSAFPNRAQMRSFRGVGVRALDHVTVMASDVLEFANWRRDTLNFRFMEWTTASDESDLAIFALVSTNESVHDMGVTLETSEAHGRVHHIAFWLDTPTDLHRAAEVLHESGLELEYGPGRHGMGENTVLYFREPGGFRIELNSGGYRNYLPDWETVRWKPSQGSSDMFGTSPLPAKLWEAFPPQPGDSGTVNRWPARGVN